MVNISNYFNIFAYLKSYHNARLGFDPTYPEINDDDFERKDWSGFYGDDKEPLPVNAPKPRGKEFIMRAYVDASFAGCKLSHRSRTGFIIFLNSSPVYWFSKI